ncbi:MAG: thiosulfate oxidation carrier complex protein SoxZ, partial [Gammaproteobacteria bacterium]|nr:thiosulfate oxidation carrier complex protein SoxZ [Gammaproteobacteria bacterium]
NGELAGTLNLGPGVSADPYLSLDIAGAASSDKVSLQWEDSKGESDMVETAVK